jgi:guanylate kinase
MNKLILLIMGKSGCGKSTLERNLIQNWPGQFKKVVSSTTRPKRQGEMDGVDYWFISESEYDRTDFIQTTEFAGYRYGSSVREYQTRHPIPILCVVPSSGADFTKTITERFPLWGTFNIYFDIDNDRLISNMESRGDSIEYITERVLNDTLDKQFEQSGLLADFTVKTQDLNEGLAEIVSLIVLTSLESSRRVIHTTEPDETYIG